MTRFEFSSKIGSSPSAIQGWEKGTSVPKADALLKIHDSLGISIDWLLTGNGQMYERQPADEPNEAGKIVGAENAGGTEYNLEVGVPKEITAQVSQTGQAIQHAFLVFIPIALPKVSKSNGEFIFEESSEKFFAFPKSWLQRMESEIGNLVLLPMRGDSMAPFICSGDVVMIDGGRRDITEGCVYAIAIEGMVYLKKLVLIPTGRIKVISENKDASEPFEIDRKDLRILGEVIWFSRQLG